MSSDEICANLQHFQATLRTPSAGNWVDEISTDAPHFQRAGECVWLAFLVFLRGLILKDHNHVHARVSDNQKL
jgi:hypothetical protein